MGKNAGLALLGLLGFGALAYAASRAAYVATAKDVEGYRLIAKELMRRNEELNAKIAVEGRTPELEAAKQSLFEQASFLAGVAYKRSDGSIVPPDAKRAAVRAAFVRAGGIL